MFAKGDVSYETNLKGLVGCVTISHPLHCGGKIQVGRWGTRGRLEGGLDGVAPRCGCTKYCERNLASVGWELKVGLSWRYLISYAAPRERKKRHWFSLSAVIGHGRPTRTSATVRCGRSKYGGFGRCVPIDMS